MFLTDPVVAIGAQPKPKLIVSQAAQSPHYQENIPNPVILSDSEESLRPCLANRDAGITSLFGQPLFSVFIFFGASVFHRCYFLLEDPVLIL